MENEEIVDVAQDFRDRARDETDKVNALMTIPQLTCGQFSQDEIMGPYEAGFRAIGVAREQDYEMFQFYPAFYKKFAKEIEEYNDMRERFGDIGKDELRRRYLDEKKYPEQHNARWFNPCWKEYVG